jgi:formylglycine-generating enzyme required for sulfatase activity
MAGNASEWCADDEDQFDKMVKSGSWNYDYQDTFRCASSTGLSPDYRRDYVGFRLAAGPG